MNSARPQVYKKIKNLLLTRSLPIKSPIPSTRLDSIKTSIKPTSQIFQPKQPRRGIPHPTFKSSFHLFKKRLIKDSPGKLVVHKFQILHVEYTRFIELCNQVKGLSVSDSLIQLKFHRKPITNMFLKGLKDAIVNCGNRGFDLDKTYIADVYVHENGAVLSKLLKKRFIRGRARYGSDQHVKSSLVKFILQEREKPFKSRVNDPLEWVRERMRLKIGGGESGASVAQKAFDGLRKYRRELKIWN